MQEQSEHLNFSKYLEFTIGADDTEWKSLIQA